MSKKIDLKEYFNALTKEQLVERMYKTEIAMKQNIKTAIECATELEQALTPPTADEVCKALSEYLKEQNIFDNFKIEYSKVNKDFNLYTETIDGALVLVSYHRHGVMYYWEELPPFLTIMTSRFYEGKLK